MPKKHEKHEQDLETPDIDFMEVQDAEPFDMKELEEAKQQRDEYLNMAQRVQADFDNYRRRNNAARAEAYDDGAFSFIKTLFPIIDNLERALQSAKDSPDTALRDGVQMILNQLTETLAKRGVTPIDRVGEPFDPNLENAVLQGTQEEGEPGSVCEVFQKGYQTEKTVLRHAMVKVVAE
jgi:Molecular chaperone GrpE (heat shock protein)